MKDLLTKRGEAKARQDEYNKLDTAKKILKLDLHLGGGTGAIKQRFKLSNRLIKEAHERATKVDKPVQVKEQYKKGSKNPQYKIKERTRNSHH